MTSNDKSIEEGYENEDAQMTDQKEDVEGAQEQEPGESGTNGNGFLKRKPKKARNTQTPLEDTEKAQDQERSMPMHGFR